MQKTYYTKDLRDTFASIGSNAEIREAFASIGEITAVMNEIRLASIDAIEPILSSLRVYNETFLAMQEIAQALKPTLQALATLDVGAMYQSIELFSSIPESVISSIGTIVTSIPSAKYLEDEYPQLAEIELNEDSSELASIAAVCDALNYKLDALTEKVDNMEPVSTSEVISKSATKEKLTIGKLWHAIFTVLTFLSLLKPVEEGVEVIRKYLFAPLSNLIVQAASANDIEVADDFEELIYDCLTEALTPEEEPLQPETEAEESQEDASESYGTPE